MDSLENDQEEVRHQPRVSMSHGGGVRDALQFTAAKQQLIRNLGKCRECLRRCDIQCLGHGAWSVRQYAHHQHHDYNVGSAGAQKEG